MPPIVETSTPPHTPSPIGPYNHVAKVAHHDRLRRDEPGLFGRDGRPPPARTAVAVKELPKPGALLTMNLTAVTRD